MHSATTDPDKRFAAGWRWSFGQAGAGAEECAGGVDAGGKGEYGWAGWGLVALGLVALPLMVSRLTTSGTG